jgi:serine phosphatase RsbU (regulator of sigma subunit)
VRVLAHLLGPAELLEALDRFVLQVPDALFASVAVVKLDTLARRATYSLAGHLPPLASSPDGEVIELAGALGPPLGVDKRPRRQDTFLLPDAATVILYTDGLVERRGEALDVGIARLAALLSRSRELNVDAVCAQLVRGSIEGTAQRDDIALLCARLPG